MPIWLFVFLAALAVISGLGVILQRNPVHCVLALALVLIDMGVLFMGLGAVTVGFLQIIVYVGAIMVLFLFVIWLLNIQSEESAREGHLGLKFIGAVGAAALIAEFFAIFLNTPAAVRTHPLPADYGSIESLAHLLFSSYLIAFEATSILLLAAIVGAIALARRVQRTAGKIVNRTSSSISSTEKAA
ncbi:MAG TPA: NADH-quinone oxidoreductase subunit J [Candidatus Binataceae bacterium]|nr:NADH-quinone oxidoreductase subunit J [Candidatus Binataceae bacterium]